MTLAALLSGADLLARSSSSSSDPGGLGLVFLLSGFVFYGYVFLKYRNTGKRHHHETETKTVKLNLTERDELLNILKGLTNSRMVGANNTSVGGAGGLSPTLNKLAGLNADLGSFINQAAATAHEVRSDARAASENASRKANENVAREANEVPPPPSAPPTDKPGQAF